MTVQAKRRTRGRWALAVSLAALAACFPSTQSSAANAPSMKAAPRAQCGPGDRPETGLQGRVPPGDYKNGRAAAGYTCNTRKVSHFGKTAGLKVFRYADHAGHTCAYYDSTQMFPTDVPANLGKDGLGVVVLDMSDPSKPKKTANLTTPAMLTPHESMQLNQKRGLLVAVAGNALTYPGVVDVYDLTKDCRQPQWLSSTPLGVLGHESAMAPDGLTFYASSSYGQTVAAVDLTNPMVPVLLWAKVGVIYHGMSVSDDGKRLYAANDDISNLSLDILDVSQIQARAIAPQPSVISNFSWPSVSIPQVPLPFTVNKRPYLLEIDEFNSTNDVVGAARIIDIQDDRHPRLTSNIRLEVHEPANRAAVSSDPGAGSPPFGGVAAHYCALPKRDDPGLAACAFITSGLRIFDIRDPQHPREVGYFNMPTSAGSHAMAAPTWDVAHGQVWYSDTNSGFYAVQLTNGLTKLLAPKPATTAGKPAASGPPPATASSVEPSTGDLPTTGLPITVATTAVLLLAGAGAAHRRLRQG